MYRHLSVGSDVMMGGSTYVRWASPRKRDLAIDCTRKNLTACEEDVFALLAQLEVWNTLSSSCNKVFWGQQPSSTLYNFFQTCHNR